METLIVHIKEKRDIKTVKSFLSTIKSAKIIKEDIINGLEISKISAKDLANFEEGTYKKGDKPSDFVCHKTPIKEDEAEKQYQDLRKKVWKLK